VPQLLQGRLPHLLLLLLGRVPGLMPRQLLVCLPGLVPRVLLLLLLLPSCHAA
jgi:hypothetical protein